MSRGESGGQLELVPVVVLALVVRDAGLREAVAVGDPGAAERVEEPEAVARDRPAERRLVRLVENVLTLHLVLHLVRVQPFPRRLVVVRAPTAREAVAAALRDDVDDTAGEAAVLGGDPGGEHLRLLDRIRDVECVRGAEQIVVRVDTVDQVDVVVGERAVDSRVGRRWACWCSIRAESRRWRTVSALSATRSLHRSPGSKRSPSSGSPAEPRPPPEPSR